MSGMNTAISRVSNNYPGRVLVVDDDESNRMLLRDPLEAQGHVVYEAADGEQALRVAEALLPDAVLLDLMMPGMDGFEVCQRLKQSSRTAHIPVIMVTAATARKERLVAIDCGASDFLTKPVDLTELVLRVRNTVNHKREMDSIRELAARAVRNPEEESSVLLHKAKIAECLAELRDLEGDIEALLTPAQRTRLWHVRKNLAALIASDTETSCNPTFESQPAC